MNVVAFVLATLAIVVFLCTVQPPGRWAHIGVGLALLTAAWIVQLVWQVPSVVVHR